MLVTKKTEKAAGLEGLMNHLAQGKESVNTDTTIAMFFGEVNGKKFTPVDKNGKPLDEVTFDNAVYQVMPLEDLKWSEEYKGDTLFRDKDLGLIVVYALLTLGFPFLKALASLSVRSFCFIFFSKAISY